MERGWSAEVGNWATQNFGKQEPYRPLLGVMEEVGELCHAQLKSEQGIRTNEDHEEDKVDAIGDIVIYLAHYCDLIGVDLSVCINRTWDKVKQRDWNKNPEGPSDELS